MKGPPFCRGIVVDLAFVRGEYTAEAKRQVGAAEARGSGLPHAKTPHPIPLLHYNLAIHPRVRRADVIVAAGLSERDGFRFARG